MINDFLIFLIINLYSLIINHLLVAPEVADPDCFKVVFGVADGVALISGLGLGLGLTGDGLVTVSGKAVTGC